MEKFIITNNCTKDELKTILQDWLVMYADRLNDKLVFEFAEINPNSFILRIDKYINDTNFFNLVNYFAFPIDFKKTFEVTGYATASKHKEILNKNIYVFTNQEDTDFDNVWITTEDNETYKYDFAGKFTRISENNYKYIEPNIDDKSVSYEQIIIDKKELWKEAEKKRIEKEKRKLEKRFKVISILLFIGIPVVFLINSCFFNFDIALIMFFALAIHFWFLFDYEIFYNLQRTLICVLLSLLFIVFGISTKNIFFATISTIPLSSIIIMLLTNKLLGTKIDSIEDSDWYRLFWLLLLVLAVLISTFAFNPILEHIME